MPRRCRVVTDLKVEAWTSRVRNPFAIEWGDLSGSPHFLVPPDSEPGIGCETISVRDVGKILCEWR